MAEDASTGKTLNIYVTKTYFISGGCNIFFIIQTSDVFIKKENNPDLLQKEF